MERIKKRRRLIRRQQLQDVPELIQQIQSLLPADQAARTCVVSKSWLHALSTTPDLRFQPVKSLNKQQETQYMRLINRTLQRYHRDNLPIITCDLHFGIHMQRSTSSAEKSIKLVTSNTCLEELCLTILPAVASYTLPDELFSSEKLDKLSLKLDKSKSCSLHISSNPVFNCVNLRVLELRDVHISEDVLHNLLSSFKLLEKINLKLPEGLEKIKVNNLRYLHELKIATRDHLGYLEISNVPCLRSLSYNAKLIIWRPVLSNMVSFGSLRELCLNYISMDAECSDMINSKFPFLESLALTLIC
ncbi:putative F-box/LRR-repeat protein isoform X2, partial [Tanacetum coccineum]